MNCNLCNHNNLELVYSIENIPIFQNKVFTTKSKARETLTGNVFIVQCCNCGFIFNSDFNNSIMNYNEEYQNEQSNSAYFRDYLDGIVTLLIDYGFKNKKIIEIGCGKGYFLEKLTKTGFDATGFDPAYEGSNSNIVKDYFSKKYSDLNADLIILRHTLEHIQNPKSFLLNIARANNNYGKIFIEVPTLEWILDKAAFWDIFYEHVNYFTQYSLGNMFVDSFQGLLFHKQYQFIIAELSKLNISNIPLNKEQSIDFSCFTRSIDYYKMYVKQKNALAIWGAGAKGTAFLNMLDPNREFVKCVIDINPKKQNKYIAKTGHLIVKPSELDCYKIENILVMNENYLNEIHQIVNNDAIKIECL